MAPPTESDDILAAEQKEEERNKAEAEKKKKEADEEAMKLRNAQLELANSIRHKGRPGNNRQPVSKVKMVSSNKSDFTPGLQSHQAKTSTNKPGKIDLLGMKLPEFEILKMGIIKKISPVSSVDQSAAAVASVSSSTGSEILIGQIPIRLPSSSEKTKTSDQEMNNNVELALEKDNNINNNAEAETAPGTNIVSATLPVEEIDDLNAVPETNQYANAIDLKEIPLVSGAETTLNHGKSNDDDSFEATGNEAIREEEQNESTGEAIFLGAPTTSVHVQEEKYNMNDVPESPETNQFTNATDVEEIPLVPNVGMSWYRCKSCHKPAGSSSAPSSDGLLTTLFLRTATRSSTAP